MEQVSEAEKILRKNSFPNWKDILSIIGVFFLAAIFTGLILMPFENYLGGASTFISYVIHLMLVVIYGLYLKKRRTGTFRGLMRFSIHGLNPRLILWGVILMFSINLVVEPLTDLFPSEYLDYLVKALGGSGGWAMLTTIVAAPILEEILFRGIIQESMTRKYGAWRSIVVASLIFGLIHGIPQQVVAGSLMGMVLGYIYYKTQSMISVIIMHAINNALAQLGMMFTDGELVSTKQMFSAEYMWIYYMMYGAAAVIVVVSLFRVIVLIRQNKFEQIRLGVKNREITEEKTETI